MKLKTNYHLLMIAFRQLSNRKRQTLLTLLGISVGVMVLITAVSLMDGLVRSFIQKIVEIAPHVIVSGERVKPTVPDQLVESSRGTNIQFIKNTSRSDQEVIKNYPRVESLIESDSAVELVSPSVSTDVIGMFGTLSEPVQLFGIIPPLEDGIAKFSRSMVSGNFEELGRTPDGILLGATAAKDFTVRVGDRMRVVSQSGKIFGVRVVGIFQTGINDIDDNCYVNIRLGQNIGGFSPDEASNLHIRVKDLPKDAAVANAIERETNYRAITWEEQAASVVALFRMISGIVYFLVFFVIMVAGFGVANVLITNVLEKARDIAILKSIGFKRSEITWIYLAQGLMVALVGASIGCLLGYVLIEIMSSIPIASSGASAIRADRLMMGKSPLYFVAASVFALVVSLVAAVGPSRNAARVNPVEILRGER
jgi:lipoprotein-releasing system permease protein